ncbi:tRNA dihydrouridine(20/20a) synthase DusA [Dasania marina]|uniref:tRNA dihydrouridine(20/20a) synthase DusA n=1 Tax=Dasania marina TaxID=471499 RepID=UPI0030DC3EF8
MDTARDSVNRRFTVAPMMDWSDRHCRYFWRQLSQHAVLYTEMITTGAILHAGPERFLPFHQHENPLALQLGGSNPQDLGRCAKIAEDWGYDEVNLNCGCPSDRVQNGMFGACLMAQPQLVADCIKSMQDNCSIPVTVKHRIGIDDMEDYRDMVAFVEPIAATGCKTFIVHARKAWLQGLSPKENREIPPLQYDMVYRLKKDFPDLEIILNGGLVDLASCDAPLQQVDGVMLGRAAYQNPYVLAEVDQRFYNSDAPVKSREQVLLDFFPYIEQQLSAGAHLNYITRHILGLFQGQPGAKLFRRYISQNAHLKGAGIEVLQQALQLIVDERERAEQYHNDRLQELSQQS